MHRLSLRIALPSGMLTFLIAVILGLTIFPSAVLALATAITSYATAHLLLAKRIQQARHDLERIREHHFDARTESVRPRNDELDALLADVRTTGVTVEKQIQEMKRLENHRREYVGNVSHELKTPIFAVQGFAETLLDGAIEDERVRRSFVEKILRNATRLSNLARDLSELSRIETGDIRLNPAAFSVARLLREVTESLEVHAAERQVQLQFSVPDWLPPAHADREAIRQVLLNLADNAIKYNNPGGLVELTARRVSDDTLRITVADNGIGIDPEDLPRVTERFFRVDKSRSRSEGGTGLGLAIVKHLLAAHNRKLTAESTPGKGSTFGFSLSAATGMLQQGSQDD